MKTLKQFFEQAKSEKWAIGHFNFSTADQLKAIVKAASKLSLPVMVATSEGEAKYFGYEQAATIVKSYQREGHEVFLNADHHKSFETIKRSVDAGYDTILIDGSKFDYEKNVELTRKSVEYARSVKPDMMVEGELGYLRGSSEVQTKVEISSADYTKPEEASEFVKATGIDRLAIVFGNIHGIVTEQKEKLDIEHLKRVVAAVPDTYLVLHGASGLDEQDIQNAVASGITNIHINTEIRVAYHDAIKKEMDDKPDQTTPYKFLDPAFRSVEEVVSAKLKLFANN